MIKKENSVKKLVDKGRKNRYYSTEITHRGIRKLIIDHPWLILSNFDIPKEKPEINLGYYISYDKVEPIPEELL